MTIARILFFSLVTLAMVSICSGQDLLPTAGPARSAKLPAVKEGTLKNGIRVAVVERKQLPTVSVSLLIDAGSDKEDAKKAGLASLTAGLLTKGTKNRTATEIAEQTEFNVSSVYAFSRSQAASVVMGSLVPNLDKGMEIFSDIVRNPIFPQAEVDLQKNQTLASLKSQLSDPTSIALYAGSVYSFRQHPTGGTPASIEGLTRADVEAFYKSNYSPAASTLIFVGDITFEKAMADAEKYFGTWEGTKKTDKGWGTGIGSGSGSSSKDVFSRFLVLDLPESGQASVNYFKLVGGGGRGSADYYSASVLNSLLGGGYSSRLNQEIRIKRGLSYGARSFFTWRNSPTMFTVSTQTKEESAAEVAELILAELNRLITTAPTSEDLTPRKSVLTGNFGRSLETNNGIASALGELYSLNVPASQLNSYVQGVDAIGGAAVTNFAKQNFVNGDIVIVGDYSKFKDDLAKRFPNTKIDVIKVDDLNIESPTLRKGDLK